MRSGAMRLFFALWPAREMADALTDWAAPIAGQSGGRLTRAETIHMTLAFLGNVPDSSLPRACAAARRMHVLASKSRSDLHRRRGSQPPCSAGTAVARRS